MNTAEFIAGLQQLGVALSVDGDRLSINAPKGVFTAELRQALTERKQEVIEYLQAAATQTPEPGPTPAAHSEDDGQLSRAQRRLWFLDQLEPGNPVYNVPVALRMSGRLDLEALERALREIYARHNVLRNNFVSAAGAPKVKLRPADEWAMSGEDLRELPAEQREQEAMTRIVAEARRPFDLASDALFRARILELSEEQHILIVTLHHSVADGWSLGLLSKELGALYTAFAAGEPSPLAPLQYQYSDYTRWEREMEATEDPAHISYWKEQLGGELPVLELPADHPRPAVQTFNGRRIPCLIPRPLIQSLQSVGREHGATMFMVLLAAFKVLLSRYTRLEDIIVGTATSYRSHEEFSSLMGFFVNNLVLRTDLSGDPAFASLLGRVRETSVQAYAHQNVSFNRLVEVLQPRRDRNHSPLFQVMFTLQNLRLPEMRLPGLRLTVVPFEIGVAHYDLSIEIWEKPEGYQCDFEFDTDLFEPAAIERLTGHYRSLLEAVARNSRSRLSELPLLTPREERQIVVEWNDTAVEYPRDRSLHQFIEEQVERTPDAPALVFESCQLTYRELNARANQLAHRLRRLGVGPEALVAVCAKRSIEMVVALLATVKAGGAYVPIDPDYPPQRLAVMLEDAEPRVLLTLEALLDVLPEHGIPTICLDRDWPTLAGEPTANLPVLTTGKDQAYVIYTSGSTGKPKGVPNVHEAIVNRLLWMQSAYKLEGTDRVVQKTPYSFDVSVWEFFWPLMTGACLVVAQPEGHKDPQYLIDLIAGQKITTIHFVPSMLRIFLESEGVERCTGLRRVICSGEALSLQLQERFFEKLGAELHNLYGPTEAAVDVTYWRCQPHSGRAIVPIGRPIWNTQIYILDKYLQPVPAGVPGEMHIGGAGLARGYLKRPELTAEKFIPDPFSLEPGARLYKTGDLARFLSDGTIEYLGRLDFQVKMRGFRIEPGEIETALMEAAGVKAAVVVIRSLRVGDDRLIAYYVPGPTTPQQQDQIRAILRVKLPPYMVPNLFVPLDTLPLTGTGKVATRLLPAPDLAPAAAPSRDLLDETEERMARIMAELLNVEHVGPEDDFFALGGHSLLGMQLVARIETEFGQKLPAAVLFQSSSVESLARLVKENRPSYQCLMPIQPNGKRPPLFFIHGLDGDVLFYWYVIRSLDTDLPAYGVRASILDTEQDRPLTMEAMARYYVTEMRRLQPVGPYRLCGFSFGGVMAFEVARQLHECGETVSFLGILDAATYGLRIPWTAMERVSHFTQRLRYRFRVLRESTYKEMLAYVRHQSSIVRQRLSPAKKTQVHKAVAHWIAPERHQIAIALQQAIFVYEPQPYPGKAVLFRARDRRNTSDFDPQNGWGKVITGGIEVHEFNGDHVTFIKEPHATEVAGVLNQLLSKLDAAARTPEAAPPEIEYPVAVGG